MEREKKKESGRKTILNEMRYLLTEGKLMRDACVNMSYEQSKIVRERQDAMFKKWMFLSNYTKASDKVKCK